MSDYAVSLSTGFMSYDDSEVKTILERHFGASYPESQLNIIGLGFGHYKLEGPKDSTAAFFQRLRYLGLLASDVEDIKLGATQQGAASGAESGERRIFQSAIITCKQLNTIERLPVAASEELIKPLENLAKTLAERINQEIFSGYTGNIAHETLRVTVHDGMPVCNATFCLTYTAPGTNGYGECHTVVKGKAVDAINKILGLGGRGPKVEEVHEVTGESFKVTDDGATHKIRVRLPLAGLALQRKASVQPYIALSLMGRAYTPSAGKIAALKRSNLGVEMVSISQSFPTIKSLLLELRTTLCAVIAFHGNFDAWHFPQLVGHSLCTEEVIAEIIKVAGSGGDPELKKIIDGKAADAGELADGIGNDSGYNDEGSDGDDATKKPKPEAWFSHDPIALLTILRDVVKVKVEVEVEAKAEWSMVQKFVACIDQARVPYDSSSTASLQQRLISVGGYEGLQSKDVRAYCDAAMRKVHALGLQEEGRFFEAKYDEARNGLDKKEKKHIPESGDVCPALLTLLKGQYGESLADSSFMSGLLANAILDNLGQFLQMVSCSTKDKAVWVRALHDIIGVFFVDVLRVVKNIIQAERLELTANYCSFASDDNGDLFATTILTAMEIVRELQVPHLSTKVGFNLFAPKLVIRPPRAASVAFKDGRLSTSPTDDSLGRSVPPPMGTTLSGGEKVDVVEASNPSDNRQQSGEATPSLVEEVSMKPKTIAPPPVYSLVESSTSNQPKETTSNVHSVASNFKSTAEKGGGKVNSFSSSDEARPAPVAKSRFVPPEAIPFGLLFGLGCVLYNREPLVDYSQVIAATVSALLVAGGVSHMYSKKDPTTPNPNLFSKSDDVGQIKKQIENATAVELGLTHNK